MGFQYHLNQSLKIYTVLFCSVACMQTSKLPEKQSENLSGALWELAADAEEAKDYEKAAAYYDRLYERHPKEKNALLGYARNLRYLGLSKDAIKALRASDKKLRQDLDLQIELGKSQLADSLINDSSDTLVKAIERDPLRWESHSALGIIFDRLGNYTNARKAYERALELSPNNIGVKNNLALSLAQAGRLDEAINILETIVAKKSAGPQSRQNLAMLYGLKGEFDKARILTERDLPTDLSAQNILTFKQLHKTVTKREATSKIRSPSNSTNTQPDLTLKPNASKTSEPIKKLIYISLRSTNVRKGLSIKHPSIAVLQKNQEVQFLGRSENGLWSFIALQNGQKGYVSYKLVQRKR